MSIAQVAVRPPLMTLINMSTQESCEIHFNPEEFSEAIGQVRDKVTVPGLSHQVTQFKHTKNRTIPVRLFYNATNLGPAGVASMKKARLFFISACHPRAGVANLKSAGSPRILFVWPDFMSISSYLMDVTLRYTKFNLAGTPVSFVAELKLEEVRDELVTSEEVSAGGTTPKGGRSTE